MNHREHAALGTVEAGDLAPRLAEASDIVAELALQEGDSIISRHTNQSEIAQGTAVNTDIVEHAVQILTPPEHPKTGFEHDLRCGVVTEFVKLPRLLQIVSMNSESKKDAGDESHKPSIAVQTPVQGPEAGIEKPSRPREIGGRKDGTEPTRFGDWEKKGRCIDF